MGSSFCDRCRYFKVIMNIHEHQAKKILKKYGATVPDGVFAFTVDELIEKAKS